MRSVEKKVSSNGSIYFQIKVNRASLIRLSEELVDLYNFDSWITARGNDFMLNVFYNDKNNKAMEWDFISCKGNSNNSISGLVIGEINARFEAGVEINYKRIENLYIACEKGLINVGCLLHGAIVKRDVEPYWFDGKMVSSSTLPILWPTQFSIHERNDFVEETFAKYGKTIVDKENIEWHKKHDTHRYYDAISDDDAISDGYGGDLDDDFINDVLDGDADSYWNID